MQHQLQRNSIHTRIGRLPAGWTKTCSHAGLKGDRCMVAAAACSSIASSQQWQQVFPSVTVQRRNVLRCGRMQCPASRSDQQPTTEALFPPESLLQQQQQQQQQHPEAGSLEVQAKAPWALVVGVLQQGLVLAAVSSIVLSVCLTGPAASATAVQQQRQQGTVQLAQLSKAAPSTRPHQQLLAQWQPHQQQQRAEDIPVLTSQLPELLQFELDSSSSSLRSQQQLQQPSFDVSSQLEDSLLEGMRQWEAGVDRAYGALSSSVHMMDAAQARTEQAVMDAQAQALINEVWEVVDLNYLDARRGGFDHEKWASLRDEALSRSYYDQQSVHRAVRYMLAQGVPDPYCRFIEPQEFASMKKYDVSGVGLNLGTAEEFIRKTGHELPRPSSANDEGVWVVGLSKGSEADRSGIEQGDQLLQIAGLPLTGVTPFQAATLIAGPDDSNVSTNVSLTVKKADGQVFDVTVQRPARVLASPVTSKMYQKYGGANVGVIRLTSFNARALRDVSAALEQLQQQGASEWVLDLRDNRGGLVSEGLEVARLFLSDSVPIVLTQSKAMAADPPKAGATAVTRLPLTVLVNEHTASASEILAGAIKDNCRGVLVGKRTYGKGLIQSVYELSDTSGLVITVGKYLTPRGVDIDRYGIAPDFSSLPESSEAEAALNACKLEAAGPSAASQQKQQPQLAGVTASA